MTGVQPVRRIRNRSNRIRKRRFCLRLSNPTQEEYYAWNDLLANGNLEEGAELMTFFVFQTERGENAERTVHYQGYVEFKKQVDWSIVKGIFGDRVHLEESRGNAASNIRYCTKNSTRYTGGERCASGQWGHPKRGGGSMMAAIKIQNGASLETIVAEHPDLAMMHYKKVESFIANSKDSRSSKPDIEILYGVTGCGKSQDLMSNYGDKAYWVAPPDGGKVWFGHYVGQDVCVFDDFHSGWFTLTKLLRVMDSTPLFVAPKCDQVKFTSKKLIFTSNVDPKEWYLHYKGKQQHKDALARRIQDFAKIFDCMAVMTPRGRTLIKILRTDTFKFSDDESAMDFSNSGNGGYRAGVGDQSSGNGFSY